MFSSRTDWELQPSVLFSLLQQKRKSGEEIIDLTESNPTHCGFTFLSDLSLEPNIFRRSAKYEPNPKGLLAARQTIAGWYAAQGTTVDPERIILTASTSEAYSFLLRLLCNPGESVAIPKPGYPLFEYLCQINDVDCSRYRLVYDGEWHLDVQALFESLTPNSRALILVHPNNPTGSFLKVDELKHVLGKANERNIPLIVDEVFRSYRFTDDDRRAGTFAGTESMLTFTVDGLSKLAGLPQMKLAWIVVSGPGEAVEKALARLEVIADTYLSVSTPVQEALGALMTHQSALQAQILNRVVTNYAVLRGAFGRKSPASVCHCEGGWYAVLRLPATRSDEVWATDLLQDANVLVHPGRLFQFDQGAYLVVSLLPALEVFSEGTRKIALMVSESKNL